MPAEFCADCSKAIVLAFPASQFQGLDRSPVGERGARVRAYHCGGEF